MIVLPLLVAPMIHYGWGSAEEGYLERKFGATICASRSKAALTLAVLAFGWKEAATRRLVGLDSWQPPLWLLRRIPFRAERLGDASSGRPRRPNGCTLARIGHRSLELAGRAREAGCVHHPMSKGFPTDQQDR